MLRGTHWHNLNKFLEGCHWMSQVSLWDYLILAHTSKWLILCLVLKPCEIYKRLTETPVVKLSHLAPPTLACHQISCVNQSLGQAQIYINNLRGLIVAHEKSKLKREHKNIAHQPIIESMGKNPSWINNYFHYFGNFFYILSFISFLYFSLYKLEPFMAHIWLFGRVWIKTTDFLK